MSDFKKVILKSLQSSATVLSNTKRQIAFLEQNADRITPFCEKLKNLEIFQVI